MRPVDHSGEYGGIDDAVDLADTLRQQAYAPHTSLQEGAVFITETGQGIVGTRVENSNYSNTRHAVETALGDLRGVDGDPAYLVLSTDRIGTGSFIVEKPRVLSEFVEPDFPVIVHDDEEDTVRQYPLMALAAYDAGDWARKAQEPEDIPEFSVELPYTELSKDTAADVVAWRDASYEELVDTWPEPEHGAGDPMSQTYAASKDSFDIPERPDALLETLWEHAQDAQDHAYEPYSDYPVGVSLLDTSGRVFTGQNIEFADISHTMHGEENALTTAVAWGLERGDVAIMNVHTESDDAPFPCGLCRQTAAEFAEADTVIGAKGRDGSDIEAYATLERILPDMFRL